MRSACYLLFLVLGLFVSRLGADQDACGVLGRWNEVTNDYYFSASSDQGAVGDVVAIDLFLTVENLRPDISGFLMAVCYDGSVLELLDEPLYTDYFRRLTFLGGFAPLLVENGAVHPEGEAGFAMDPNIRDDVAEELLSSGDPFPIGTVFFRVQGNVGESTQLRFCDEFILPSGACLRNMLLYYPNEADPLHAMSNRHVAGTINVLPGEPTRTDLPDLPPNAKVYPEAPSPEDADIRFELQGPLVARPGDSVPMRLFVTSNYEFSGFLTALRFPPEHLELTSVEEHTLPGVVSIDNETGGFGLLMSNSRRRVGQEEERVHLATLHFNVSEEARDAGEVLIEFETFENFFNFLMIHHRQGGVSANELPITAEVTPLLITDAVLKIQAQPSRLGDVNLDYEVDLTDAVNLLGTLFLGEKSVVCPEAADYNEDGRVDLSDPIAILNWLFRGGHEASAQEILCGAGSPSN